jgi:hypothetical protein
VIPNNAKEGGREGGHGAGHEAGHEVGEVGQEVGYEVRHEAGHEVGQEVGHEVGHERGAGGGGHVVGRRDISCNDSTLYPQTFQRTAAVEFPGLSPPRGAVRGGAWPLVKVGKN